MSKYNLIDIFEQYRIGSGWTSDFDYEGMLNAGLKATLEDRIDSLEALAEDFTDVNYHREASHLYDALEALEKGDAFEAEGKISDFHAEIRKTMEGFDMDMSDDLGAFMASKMEEKEETKLPMDEVDAVNFDMKADADYDEGLEDIEESFDSLAKKLDKQKGIDKDEAAKIAGSIAAKKAAGAGKGPTAKQKKRMKEASDTFNIDKVASPDAKANDYGAEIKGISDEDDTEEKYAHQTVLPLEEGGKSMKDVVLAIIKDTNATNPEVQMYIDSLTNDIKLNGKEQYADFTSDDFIEDFKEFIGNKSLQEKQYAPEVVDRIEMVRKALYNTNNFDAKEIEAYTKSLIGDFEKGDFEAYDDFKADDYVEDIKNYISDKALKEHFGRFMKDYQ